MPEETPQGATEPQTATAEPSENASSQESSIPRQDYDQLKTKYDEVHGKWDKVQNYFNANKPLVEFAYKYADDPKIREVVDRTLSGDLSMESSNSSPAVENTEVDVSDKTQLNSMIEKAIKQATQPLNDELTQLRNYYAQTQIEKLESSYTTEKGWPINFRDHKEEIATMLQSGKAVDAESAFKTIVANKLPEIKQQHEKSILEAKRNASMSRYTASNKLPVKDKDWKPTSFLEALEKAEEQTGHVLSDRLRI